MSAPAITSGPLATSAVRRFKDEQAAGKATGNYGLTTEAGFRLACATFDPVQVFEYLLREMGIRTEVEKDADGLRVSLGRFSHHSHATIMRALQGAFRVMSLMHEDGRQTIKVIGFK